MCPWRISHGRIKPAYKGIPDPREPYCAGVPSQRMLYTDPFFTLHPSLVRWTPRKLYSFRVVLSITSIAASEPPAGFAPGGRGTSGSMSVLIVSSGVTIVHL